MNAKIIRNMLSVLALLWSGSWNLKQIVTSITPVTVGGPVLCNVSSHHGGPAEAISLSNDQNLAEKHIPLVIWAAVFPVLAFGVSFIPNIIISTFVLFVLTNAIQIINLFRAPAIEKMYIGFSILFSASIFLLSLTGIPLGILSLCSIVAWVSWMKYNKLQMTKACFVFCIVYPLLTLFFSVFTPYCTIPALSKLLLGIASEVQIKFVAHQLQGFFNVSVGVCIQGFDSIFNYPWLINWFGISQT